MKKRNFLKSTLAGSLITAWVPPVTMAILLPAHASTSCNDLRVELGIAFVGRCVTDSIVIRFEYALYSDTMTSPLPGGEIFYSGEIIDVYSTNPIHEVTWNWPGQAFIDIEIREPLQRSCTDQDGPYHSFEALSPGTLFIVTECGTGTIYLGPVA